MWYRNKEYEIMEGAPFFRFGNFCSCTSYTVVVKQLNIGLFWTSLIALIFWCWENLVKPLVILISLSVFSTKPMDMWLFVSQTQLWNILQDERSTVPAYFRQIWIIWIFHRWANTALLLWFTLQDMYSPFSLQIYSFDFRKVKFHKLNVYLENFKKQHEISPV